jgi:hypothetical protein
MLKQSTSFALDWARLLPLSFLAVEVLFQSNGGLYG